MARGGTTAARAPTVGTSRARRHQEPGRPGLPAINTTVKGDLGKLREPTPFGPAGSRESARRARKAAATSQGIVIDDGRMRRLNQSLPPEFAARLFAAQKQGASESELSAIAAEGLQEIYFKDGGRRAGGLTVEFTDIDYIDFGLLS